jgi:iron only hydrogenase large subunit-like protein
MPCVAKKYEATLNKDIDAVLTTRELANLIRKNNIDFNKLTPISGDIPFGEYSGAGVIFGTTGGVMEAAIRTASALITGKNTVCPVKYTPHPKFNGVLTTSVTIGTTKLKAAVVSGAINIFNFLHNEDINKYQFIEFMACAGGCINGGGQPIINKNLAINADYISKRKSVLTNQDNKLKVRMSHLNPAVINLYKKMKVVPCDKNAHILFHNK